MGADWPDYKYYPYSDGSIRDDFGGTNVNVEGVPAQPLNQYHVYQVSAQSNNWAAWVNGVLQYQTTNNGPVSFAGTANGLALGQSYYIASPWAPPYWYPVYFNGDIAEVLVFNRGLSVSERTTVSTYLNGKYTLVPAVPATPTNLIATAISTSQISLTWNEALTNGGATQISIERKTGVGGTYAVIAQVANALSYMDTNLTAGTTYYYQVRAINLTQWSPYSNETNATTLAVGTDMPLGNLALWLKADSGLAQLGTNTPVSLWIDQSGHTNNATQNGGTNRPIWIAGTLNTLPVVRFNPTNGQYLKLPSFMNAATGGEAFVVLRVAAARPTRADLGMWA